MGDPNNIRQTAQVKHFHTTNSVDSTEYWALTHDLSNHASVGMGSGPLKATNGK